MELARVRAKRQDKGLEAIGTHNTVTREGIGKVLNGQGGRAFAELLGVDSTGSSDKTAQVDKIVALFDLDNDGELDHDESQMLLALIRRRAQDKARDRGEVKKPASHWPRLNSSADPVGDGSPTIENRVQALAAQSIALGMAVADHNSGLAASMESLDFVVETLAHHLGVEGAPGTGVLRAGVGASNLADGAHPVVVEDLTLPLLHDRAT